MEKRKTKRRVTVSSFTFENVIIDVVLSNRFRKQKETKRKFQAKTSFFVFFFNDEKMFLNDVFKLKICTKQSQICWEEMFYHVGCNIDCKKKNIFKQKHGPSNPKKSPILTLLSFHFGYLKTVAQS